MAFKRSLKVIFVLIIFGQLYFFNKYLVLGEKAFLYPQNPVMSALSAKKTDYFRFQAFGVPVKSNFSIMENIYSPEGFDPIFPKRYGQLAAAAKNGGKLTEDLPRIEVALFQLGRDDTLANPNKLRFLSLVGAKHILYFDDGSDILPSEKIFPPELFKTGESLGKWQTFSYQNVLPRTFLVGNIVVENDPQKILDRIFDENFKLAKAVVVEEAITLPKGVDDQNDRAEITGYSPERVEIKTAATSPRLLFLSDNYFPGWKATVDDLPTKIYRTDFTFRGVLVPAGNHLVKFTYDPYFVKIGAVISTAAAGILVIFLGLAVLLKL